jgi:hypothetical protein
MTDDQGAIEADGLPRPRRLFRPWTACFGAALIVVLCGLALLLKPYADHLALIHRIERNGASVWCDRGGPEWLRGILGDRFGRALDPIDLVFAHSPPMEANETRNVFRAVNGLKSVRLLSLDLTDDELRVLDCPYLRSLDLYSSVSDDGLRELNRFPELTAVGLTGSQITDAGLAQLSSIPYLQTVTLRHCDGISDRGIERLAETTPLLWFEIDDCPELGDRALCAVAASHRLQILRIASCNRMTDDGLSALAGSSVKRLEISNCIGVRGPGLSELKHCPSLIRLRLFGNVYGDEHAAHLHEFNHPMNIEFVGTRVTPAARRELETSLPFCSVELSRY